MSTKLGLMAADFRTSLATEIAIAGTAATLQSNLDDDGITLPTGVYMFTLDGDNSAKEHIVCTNTAGVLSAISSISRQGTQTSGVARKHRIGASVVITDFAHIMYMNNLLKGTTDLDHLTPLKYDGSATISDSNALATKEYVDGVAVAGASNASTTVKGIIEIATAAEMAAGTGTGGTGAVLVPPNSSLVKTSSGAGDENKIPILDAAGTLANGFVDKVRTWGTVQTFTHDTIQITGAADSGNDGTNKTYVDGAITTAIAAATLMAPLARGTTPLTVYSTTAETTILTVAVPGGVLGTTQFLKMRFYFSKVQRGGSGTLSIKLKYGGTLFGTFATANGLTSDQILVVEALLMASGATNTQRGSMSAHYKGANTDTVAHFGESLQMDSASLAIDSTASQNFIITVTPDANNGSVGATLDHYEIEKSVN